MLPWLLLAGAALFLACKVEEYLRYATPYIRFRLPSPFTMVKEQLPLLYSFPIVLLLAGILSVWVRCLRRAWAPIVASFLLFSAHLLVAYVLLWRFPPQLGEPLRAELGSEVREVMETADRITLYSLGSANSDVSSSPAEFHGHPVLGKIELATPADRSSVSSALLTSIDESFGLSMMCFEPRHAMRFERGTNHVDILICYECYKLVISRGEKSEYVCLTQSSKSTLNRWLRKAAVPLAPEK